jgi:HEAT repeat protein
VLDKTLDHVDVAARFNAAEGIAKVDAEMRETTLAFSRIAVQTDMLSEIERSLGDDRSPFRARAVGTLAAVSDETRETAADILPALASVDSAERAAAVRTLGELDAIASAALPVLIKAAAQPDNRDLVAALIEAGDQLPLDETSLRPLLQALNDRDPAVRAAAAESLQRLAETAGRSKNQLAGLPRDDRIIRRFAGRAEATLDGFAPAVLPALQPAVADEDPRVRAPAVTALGLLGPAAEPAVPLLTNSLADLDDDALRRAVQALGRIGSTPEIAVPALADRLFASDPRVACEAGRALGLFGHAARPVAPQLLAAAESDESGPGFCAGVALFAVDPVVASDFWSTEIAGSIPQIEVETMLESIKGPAPFPRQIDLPVGPDAVAALPSLVQALATAPGADRPALAELLTSVADEVRDHVAWLTRELAQGDAFSRATAVRLLGQFASTANATIPSLVDGLDHPDETVKLAMVRTFALIAVQTTAATQALLAVALKDDRSSLRADAATSLSQFAALQITAGRGPALVAEAPINRAGQSLVRFDPQLIQ